MHKSLKSALLTISLLAFSLPVAVNAQQKANDAAEKSSVAKPSAPAPQKAKDDAAAKAAVEPKTANAPLSSKLSVRWNGVLPASGSVELRSFQPTGGGVKTLKRNFPKSGDALVFEKVRPGPFVLSVSLGRNSSGSFQGGAFSKWGVLKEGEMLSLELGKSLIEREASFQLPQDNLASSLKFLFYVNSPAPVDGVDPVNIYAVQEGGDPRIKEYLDSGLEEFRGNYEAGGSSVAFFTLPQSVKVSMSIKGEDGISNWLYDFSYLESERKRNVDLRQSGRLQGYLDIASLAKDSSVDGYVRYPDGRPAEGVQISNFMDADKWIQLGSFKAVTDKDGYFKVESLPAVNRISCSLSPPPGYAAERIVYEDIDTNKEIVLRSATIIKGKVEVSETVQLPQRRVFIEAEWKGGRAYLTCDPGSYVMRLDGIRAASVVKVTVEPYRGSKQREQENKPEPPFEVKTVNVSPGNESSLDFFLK